jgi:hypothetical protein
MDSTTLPNVNNCDHVTPLSDDVASAMAGLLPPPAVPLSHDLTANSLLPNEATSEPDMLAASVLDPNGTPFCA